jgi:acyl-CoA synthetase (AMP-forming)/AMP-acid ligase II
MPETVFTAAAGVSIGDLFLARVKMHPERVALADDRRTLSYAALNGRVNRLASVLTARGLTRGDRISLLSENRGEYLELLLATAKLGLILACQNWRLAPQELLHCTLLVSPKIVIVSERYAETFAALDHGAPMTLVLGDEYERALSVAPASEPPPIGEPEDGYLILYTSGTTGLPKGALISQRAAIARTTVFVIDRITVPGRTHIAWAPLCHIVATDPSLATLLNGGKVIVIDGADVGRILEFAAVETIDHLMVVPGIVERFLKEARATNFRPFSVTTVGCMADLVPRHQIAELTELMQAPYRNSFGMTETAQIATAGVVPIGVVPERLSKTQSSLCRIRLVDANDEEVPDGEPGEVAYRGPSLFSGYWNNQSATEHDFRGGWFHTGDVLVRNPDGTLDFVDRRKYLIKSGGENIYPAEIERVLLASSRVRDAVVIRRPDPQWGEVPVVFVVPADPTLTADEIIELCKGRIAKYKIPKAVYFVEFDALPRNGTGKVMRHLLETQSTELSRHEQGAQPTSPI